MSASPRARVLGIGSPYGLDRIGWLVVEALRRDPRFVRLPGVEAIALDRPGVDLVRFLAGVERVVLIDALVGTEPAGAVLVLPVERLLAEAGDLSSHAIGVAQALGLAAALAALPRQLTVLGVAIGPAPPAPAAAAVPLLPGVVTVAVDRVLACLQTAPVPVADRQPASDCTPAP